MNEIKEKLDSFDWKQITGQLNEKGYAQISGLLPASACDQLVKDYNDASRYRKVISMERYRFGLGEYKYFKYPLPALIEVIRKNLYSRLAPVANEWMKVLGIEKTFPSELQELLRLCHDNGQDKPTALILKYGEGGHNTLHQDMYGDVFFPMQAVLFLRKPGEDYTGGEFVLTQQVPRAQSKAIVLQPKQGDLLVFTTNFRPVKGTKGFYRANMKHGVSEVHQGNRYTLGIIFHDAQS
jgi:hypothetical protein